MKIRVAVLDTIVCRKAASGRLLYSDIEFMDRLAKIFRQKYADKINLSPVFE